MSVGLQRLREDADRVRQGALDKGEDTRGWWMRARLDMRRREAQGQADVLRNGRKSISERIGVPSRGGRPTARRDADLRAWSIELAVASRNWPRW